MALHLPKPRTKKPAQQAVGLDGLKVSVANAATSGVEKSKVSVALFAGQPASW